MKERAVRDLNLYFFIAAQIAQVALFISIALAEQLAQSESLSYAERPDYLSDCIVILGGITSVEGIESEQPCLFEQHWLSNLGNLSSSKETQPNAQNLSNNYVYMNTIHQ